MDYHRSSDLSCGHATRAYLAISCPAQHQSLSSLQVLDPTSKVIAHLDDWRTVVDQAWATGYRCEGQNFVQGRRLYCAVLFNLFGLVVPAD